MGQCVGPMVPKFMSKQTKVSDVRIDERFCTSSKECLERDIPSTPLFYTYVYSINIVFRQSFPISFTFTFMDPFTTDGQYWLTQVFDEVVNLPEPVQWIGELEIKGNTFWPFCVSDRVLHVMFEVISTTIPNWFQYSLLREPCIIRNIHHRY